MTLTSRRTFSINLLLILVLFCVSCNPEKVVNEYFAKAGLNRLATPRTDIKPGGLILVRGTSALYVDNMLDYLPAEPKHEYEISLTNEMAQYQAVLKKYTQDRSMDVNTAFGFVESFVPLDLKAALKLTGNVKIDLINANVDRMKIPTAIRFLTSSDSADFKRAVSDFTADKKTEAYLVYEVWRTNKLKITTDSGTTFSPEIKVKGNPMPLKLSSGEGKFTYQRTSNTELVINGDTPYVFAIRTAKLVPGEAPGSLTLQPMKFVPPKESGIKGGEDENVSYSAAIAEGFQPITITRPQ